MGMMSVIALTASCGLVILAKASGLLELTAARATVRARLHNTTTIRTYDVGFPSVSYYETEVSTASPRRSSHILTIPLL